MSEVDFRTSLIFLLHVSKKQEQCLSQKQVTRKDQGKKGDTAGKVLFEAFYRIVAISGVRSYTSMLALSIYYISLP